MKRRIGLDVGGVIMTTWVGHDITQYTDDRVIAIPAIEGVFEAVKALVQKYGSENVFIISKCREVTEAAILLWMKGNRFCEITGFRLENLYFCRERADKAPIAKTCGLTDFVDDRPDVLGYMKGVVARRYLFTDANKSDQKDPDLIDVASWADALPKLLTKV